MEKHHFSKLMETFKRDYTLYWNTLSRFNNLIVIVNISMFFLTGLVAQGYYYTFYSLASATVVAMGAIIPTPWVSRLLYYGIFVIFEFVSLYFVAVSVIYWVQHSGAV